MNAILLENRRNSGVSPQQVRLFDNLVISTSRTGCDVTPAPRCDLNGNGRVDAGDTLQALRMVPGHIPADLDCDLDNNAAGDGAVAVADFPVVTNIVAER